jgi:FixJ family two-component response regulator
MREALLVDDDRGFVETLAMLLRFEGYAVITNIAIGASNGWELVRYANQHKPDLPVVVVTGDADLFAANWEYFYTPVFLKPFDPVELFDYLRQHAR